MDIVDDEQIVEWGESKPSKKYVSKELSGPLKEKPKNVIEWLKSAETESESEEVTRSCDNPSDDLGLSFINIFRIPMRMKSPSMILPRLVKSLQSNLLLLKPQLKRSKPPKLSILMERQKKLILTIFRHPTISNASLESHEFTPPINRIFYLDKNLFSAHIF